MGDDLAIAQQLTEVRFRDRQTQAIVAEVNQNTPRVRWISQHPMGILAFRFLFNNPLFCWLYGLSQTLPHSRFKIADFVEYHHIDVRELELPLGSYRSFNDFFKRRLKPSARCFASDGTKLCSPADGHLLVLPCLTEQASFPVKGAYVNPAEILGSEEWAKPFKHGAAAIFRLAPYDYHRFHFFDDGRASTAQLVRGQYHSVHPIARDRVPNTFQLNKRMLTEIQTVNFGRVVFIEVGAIAVGSIQQTYQPGQVSRGQEKGYFQYGGSAIVLLFEPGKVTFDPDLLRDSADGLEVRVRAGESIGVRG
ncbi:MAG: phosphatidylserine decarboxylase [Cyanobacteria bacterium P01_F01_bin.33]